MLESLQVCDSSHVCLFRLEMIEVNGQSQYAHPIGDDGYVSMLFLFSINMNLASRMNWIIKKWSCLSTTQLSCPVVLSDSK